MEPEAERTASVVREALAALGLPWSEPRPGLFTVSLPGTARLGTECALQAGRHGLAVRAFVVRAPEQDHERVYRWLLQRNLKLYGVAFTLDALGDVYLTGRVAGDRLDAAEVDRVVGAVAEAADSAFNPILAMGFADAIRREWAWRRSRGEPTANLAAFADLEPGTGAARPD